MSYGQCLQVVELPTVAKMGDRDQHVFILVKDSIPDTQASLLPDNPSTRELLNSVDEINTWTTNERAGVMKGEFTSQ